jgi:hypothetical protein
MTDGMPAVRNHIFKIEPNKGERLYAMFVGDWVEGHDGSSDVLRYCLAAYNGQDFRLHYALFAQVKKEGVMILDEGATNEIGLRKIWRAFRRQYREGFGGLYRGKIIRFYEMDALRSENIFNSVVSFES